jgi:hypothetical protein
VRPLLLLTLLPLAVAAPAQAEVPVPREARAVDTSHPDRWVGTGTPRSCTSRAVVRAVARGGIIRFRCGRRPVRIEMNATAKVVNTSRRVVLDGRGQLTLSGGGKRRILYQDTCDQRQTWTTSHCQDQATPRLVVQNLTFTDGNSTGETDEGGGGGAIFRFSRGVCSNGAALSSIGVSWSVFNSVFTGNRAVGRRANPAHAGTPGGGSGGALYGDGNDFRVLVAGTRLTGNHAREGGGAIFFVSNDRSGVLEIRSSTLRRNPSDGFETDPGIFFLGRDQKIARSVVR